MLTYVASEDWTGWWEIIVKTGKILRRITAKNGKEVILRTLRWEDLDDLIVLMNSLVDEGAEIGRNVKVTRDEEADWLGKKLASLERGEEFFLVAEADGKAIGTSGLTKKKGWWSHVGELGIIIEKSYRNVGIGTEMLEEILAQAEKMGLKILTLRLFSTNRTAYHLYEKLGFRETGRIPRALYKDGKYLDEVIMTKET